MRAILLIKAENRAMISPFKLYTTAEHWCSAPLIIFVGLHTATEKKGSPNERWLTPISEQPKPNYKKLGCICRTFDIRRSIFYV